MSLESLTQGYIRRICLQPATEVRVFLDHLPAAQHEQQRIKHPVCTDRGPPIPCRFHHQNAKGSAALLLHYWGKLKST